MTVVHVALTVPAADGELLPANGFLQFTPTARRDVAGVVVLPAGFKAQLVGGVVDVDLAPTDPGWVWRVDEFIPGIPGRVIFAQVPATGPVNYADLLPIDPATLAPEATADPAWVAPYQELVDRLEAPAVTEDPNNPGLYLVNVSTKIVADPTYPSFYQIGAL